MFKGNWKKIGLGALLLATAVTLGACTNSNSGSSSSSSASGSKTLTISVDKGYKKYVNKIKDDFEKENDVKIKLVTKDMFDQLDALALDGPAGKAPDVMMSAYDRIGSLSQQGHIAEVKLPADRYNETDKQQVTYEKKTYGEPIVIETLVMYYNKDLISEAPTTFKELETISKDPKYAYENDKTKNVGFLTQWTNFYNSYGVLAAYGGYVFGKDGTDTTDIGLNNKGSLEGITYIANWFKNVWPKGMQDTKSNTNMIQDLFNRGKTAVVIDGPWSAAGYKEAGVNYGVAKIPTLDNGKAYQPFGGGKGWVISNYSKNKTVAQKWLDYVANDKNQETFYDMTQEVPANQTARKYATKQGNELTTAVIEQYKDAQPMPNAPQMAEVWTGAENLIVDAASGKKTSKQAADAAVKVIKDNISQKYGN